MARSANVDILLVEDNPDHAHFTLKALNDEAGGTRTHWVKDGEEALDFLHRRRQWADAAAAPRPSVILLDINLPKLNGHEVLRQLKTDEDLRLIPVVMLTTSDREDEVAAAYRGGANSYVTKPAKFGEFIDRVKALKQYWTLTSRIPAA